MRIAAFLVLALVACKAELGPLSDDDDGLHPDAGTLARADANAPSPDAPTVAPDNACGVPGDLGDLGTLTGLAGSELQEGSTTLRYHWVQAETAVSKNDATPDLVYVELWDDFGTFAGGAAKTGTYTISGAETDYDTCGVCVMLLANVSSSTPSKILLATSGTVTIGALAAAPGQMTKATIANATFVEINYVENVGFDAVAGSNCASPIRQGEVGGTSQ